MAARIEHEHSVRGPRRGTHPVADVRVAAGTALELAAQELAALLGLTLVLVGLLLLLRSGRGLLAQGFLEALLLGVLHVLQGYLLLALPQSAALFDLDLALFTFKRDLSLTLDFALFAFTVALGVARWLMRLGGVAVVPLLLLLLVVLLIFEILILFPDLAVIVALGILALAGLLLLPLFLLLAFAEGRSVIGLVAYRFRLLERGRAAHRHAAGSYRLPRVPQAEILPGVFAAFLGRLRLLASLRWRLRTCKPKGLSRRRRHLLLSLVFGVVVGFLARAVIGFAREALLLFVIVVFVLWQ
jgi:hypothetical protein